jgi:hypothetical protein
MRPPGGMLESPPSGLFGTKVALTLLRSKPAPFAACGGQFVNINVLLLYKPSARFTAASGLQKKYADH